MKGITHVLTGMVFGALISPEFSVILVAAIAALLPDIDTSKSLLGRKTPFWLLFAHRKLTHSLIFFFLLYVIVFLLAGSQTAYIMAFTAGFFSHLVLDALTKRGIYPFYPLPLAVAGPLKTGGVEEWVLRIVLILLFGLLIF